MKFWSCVLVVCFGCRDPKTQEKQPVASADRPPAEVESKTDTSKRAPAANTPAPSTLKLPAGPKPVDVIGRTRRDVRKVLGAGVTPAGDLDVVTIDGQLLQVTYKNGIGVKLSMSLIDYSAERDHEVLFAWLGVDFVSPAVINGRNVGARLSGDTVHVYDAAFQKAEDKRSESAADAARAKATAAAAAADAQAEKRVQAAAAAEQRRITSSRCYRTAKRLIAAGTKCGIDMTKYAADKICTELLVAEQFEDERAVGRLKIFMGEGDAIKDTCGAIRTAVDGDRI